MWDPNDLWARPIYPGESKGPSRGGLRPELDRITFGGSRGQFGPRQTQSSSAERRVEMVSDWSLKERSKISGESCCYCQSMLWTWQEPPSLAFTNLPNNFEYRLMGQVSAWEMLTLYVDEGQWTHARIKGKISNLKKGLGKKAKKKEPPSPPPGERL